MTPKWCQWQVGRLPERESVGDDFNSAVILPLDVAPGCVQSRSVGGSSSMGPPSSSVRSTTEVFWWLVLRGRKSPGRGGQRNPTTSAEVILASVQICNCVKVIFCSFLISTCLFYLSLRRGGQNAS